MRLATAGRTLLGAMSENSTPGCFALPPGIHWTPVDEVLTGLCACVSPLAGIEEIPVVQSCGRILAEPVRAVRDNPPVTNSAVDGFAFAFESGGSRSLRVVPGRSAAGEPYNGTVATGACLRILTGAALPDGTDTVVLDETVKRSGNRIDFDSPGGRAANTRQAAEDVMEGNKILAEATLLRPQDVALMVAAGVERIRVRKPLRVGVISTGSELKPAGSGAKKTEIFDANKPMLLSILRRWNLEAIDLGCAADNVEAVRSRLAAGARTADAILCSGGASAGDEDHVSAILGHGDSRRFWRVAIKPGRPLLIAKFRDRLVLGLPGNPVAAFVCTLIFARPALLALAGCQWLVPRAYRVAAAFEKSKKAGRREYLRARLNSAGAAEAFHSEGSGLISGLAWSGGLVELPDEAASIGFGDQVRYLPYDSFGL